MNLRDATEVFKSYSGGSFHLPYPLSTNQGLILSLYTSLCIQDQDLEPSCQLLLNFLYQGRMEDVKMPCSPVSLVKYQLSFVLLLLVAKEVSSSRNCYSLSCCFSHSFSCVHIVFPYYQYAFFNHTSWRRIGLGCPCCLHCPGRLFRKQFLLNVFLRYCMKPLLPRSDHPNIPPSLTILPMAT